MIPQNDINLRWIFNVILRRYWIIIGCAILGGIIAFIVSFCMPLTYKASVKLMVIPTQNAQTNEYDTLAAAEKSALAYSEMMKNVNVLKTAIDKLGLSVTPESLIKKITAEPIKETHIILLTVVDSYPEEAADIVNALANAFIQFNQKIQTQKYASLLADNQYTLDDPKELIQQVQNQINTLATKESREQTELNDLKDNQIANKADYKLLQKNQQDLQHKLQQLAVHITIAELAQPSQGELPFSTNIVTTTLIINPNPVIEGNDYSSMLAGERLASTYVQVIASRPIVEAALLKMGSQQKYEDLVENISVITIPETLLIKLMVRNPDTSQAAILANSIAEEFINQNKSKLQKNFVDQQADIEDQMKVKSAAIDQTEADISSLTLSIIQSDTEISRLKNLVEISQAADSILILEPARPPNKPIQNRIMTIILAGLVGAMIGFALVFFLQYFDDKIYTPEDVSVVFGSSSVGLIGRRQKNDPELLVFAKPQTILAEQFRILAARIRRNLDSKSPHNILLVTSSTPSDGKTFVSANLAIAMANTGLQVILVDADLRQPHIHQLFKVEESKGMAEILQKDISDIDLHSAEIEGLKFLNGESIFEVEDSKDMAEVLQKYISYIYLHSTEIEGLNLLSGGTIIEYPDRVLNSPKLEKLFASLKQIADLIIVDCPPVLSHADTQTLAAQSDGIIIVIRSGKTWFKAIQEVKDILEQIGSHLVGIVLNDTPNNSAHQDYYNDYVRQQKIRSIIRRT
jgi:succinoglycan biosynthesis transport protein ExoP